MTIDKKLTKLKAIMPEYHNGTIILNQLRDVLLVGNSEVPKHIIVILDTDHKPELGPPREFHIPIDQTTLRERTFLSA